MIDERLELMGEYQKILNSQQFLEEDLDYRIYDNHVTFLNRLDVLGSSCISIFDMYKVSHTYLSPKFTQTLGYDLEQVKENDIEFFDSMVHPEDLIQLTRNGIAVFQFCFSLPVDQRKDYKLVNEYRIRKGNGEYVRVIEQMQALELDNRGNIWLSLSLIDISPNQDLQVGVKSRVINFRKGELLEVPLERSTPPVLSVREQEVLKLIKDGWLSKEIATELSISVHTVNTHRQRILEKLGADNSFEALQYASQLGLLD